MISSPPFFSYLIFVVKEFPQEEAPTIQKLIHQHEIVLHGLLIEFPKIPSPQPNQPIQKFERQGRIGIALRHRDQINILVLDMAEGCGSESEDRGPHLGVGNDLDAENVGQSWSTVVAKGAED